MSELFYAGGLVAVVSTLLVIVQSNVVHALIYLVLSLLAVAVVFFSLGAPFVALLEAIVYAGAIMVLFVFVVMMLNLRSDAERDQSWRNPRHWAGPSLLTLLLLGALAALIGQGGMGQMIDGELLTARAVALTLFGPWLMVVELAAILLLAALVTASHVGRRSNPLRKQTTLDNRNQGGNS